MLKALIRNTKPEIILSVSDEYIDESDNTHFCNITWQWSDEHGNWASIEALGTIHASRDPNSVDYTFADASARFSDDTLTTKEEWELQELMIHHACDYNLKYNPYTVELCY